ncbi:hypothetical protein [Paenibacillus sp. W2I17]|uniref:hypothetical protein n=1 Tax=Paenibacillus sp. W2I17 TaxID=3042311 RepID=UPI0027859E36|nr:hypothetical protein [Paenibacillus sp. W2I17]MDQ0657517.1 hypothetical protein [Paenibacillus sp. W2I17]
MMAVLGDQLVAPESGWRRYDDTHVGLKYTGTWTTPSPSNTVYYGGSIRVTSRAVDNNYVTFSFFGTKLRIISDFYSDRHSDNSITIDGVTEMYSAFRAVGSPNLQQSIVYEKTGLPLAVHTVTIATGHNRINFTLDAIDIDETGYLYGHALTSPETGWRRFDDTHDAFAYLGANWIAYTGANQGIYNNSHHYTSQGKGDTEIRFKFYGTKFRLISSIGPAFANDISVVIDGVTEKFNPRMPTTADERQKVTYEKTNLPLGIHEVNLISGTNGDWRLDIDAVDIDDNGYLVARVGQQLTTPEPEWKRYDTDNYALYLGTDWKTVTNSTGRVFEGGSVRYSNVIGNYIKFSFTGDKLRLIAEYGSAYDTNVEVSIDGVIKYIDLTTSSSSIQYQPQRIAFEQLGLTDGVHEVIVKKVSGTGNFHIDAIDINVTGRMVRLIGTQLTTPDEGWRRYDNLDPQFIINGKWTTFSNASLWKGSSIYFNSTLTDGEIRFRFFGSKLRFIGYGDPNYNMSIRITINGQSETFSSTSSANVSQMLCYEKTNLIEGYHDVVIDCNGSSSYWHFDAIDIDSTGRLFHPDEVTSVGELEVGKRIRCNYVATSGAVGSFGRLGKETSDFISSIGSATPNGDFYFIMVEDWNSRKRLIADRNIQHSISWNTLSSSGLVFGVPINMDITGYNFISRLLTGGISSTDKENEWDKYIVNSTLNGSIVAGDNNVWNWDVRYSWTSTTNPGASANRVRRGGTSANAWLTSDTTITTNGYRPLVELETLPMFKSFVKHDGAYKKYAPKVFIESNDNAIPVITSNTSPSGIASASSINSASFDAYQAFNGIQDERYGWASLTPISWLQYQFPTKKIIYKYSLAMRTNVTYYATGEPPKTWIFEGSNDGVSWVVLDTQTNNATLARGSVEEYRINNSDAYTYYRVNVSANQGNATITVIAELKMFEKTPKGEVVGWNTISATLPSEDTFINDGMDDLSVFDRKNEVFVQTMTANGSLGSGKLFKERIDLKKYFEITSVSVK